MSVRKTESRIPAGLQPADLGESVTSTDGRCSLVSFISAPLTVARENIYVVFVTDSGLASSVNSWEWSFKTNTDPPEVKTTDIGQIAYTPPALGNLEINVRLLNGATEQATLSLTQRVGPPNIQLEAMIQDATNKPGAGMANPAVMREMINDHNPYYLKVTLKTPETGDFFRNFLFSTINDKIVQRNVTKRHYELDQVASSLNTGAPDFVSSIAPGLGVAGVRLALAVMMLPPNSIPFTELPMTKTENKVADEQLRQKVNAMSENDRIDWFNRVRFPKSSILLCGQLIEALRDKFFPGVKFEDVTKKMSGTMADWIILNYSQGPLHKD